MLSLVLHWGTCIFKMFFPWKKNQIKETRAKHQAEANLFLKAIVQMILQVFWYKSMQWIIATNNFCNWFFSLKKKAGRRYTVSFYFLPVFSQRGGKTCWCAPTEAFSSHGVILHIDTRICLCVAFFLPLPLFLLLSF